eukprot:6187748-Pleurochrysis_carterae.AAC.2
MTCARFLARRLSRVSASCSNGGDFASTGQLQSSPCAIEGPRVSALAYALTDLPNHPASLTIYLPSNKLA